MFASAMKAIREIVNRNKGLFAFGFVLFFLFAGLSKSFAADSIKVAGKKVQPQGTCLVVEGKDSAPGDALKAFDCDADADDFECTFFGEHSHNKLLNTLKAKGRTAGFAAYQTVDTLPLYDLFCNWKLHFS
jgi:hypothetical protein